MPRNGLAIEDTLEMVLSVAVTNIRKGYFGQ